MKLKGIVQVDEKYFRISFKGTKHEKMPRKTRHSGSQDLKIGIKKTKSKLFLWFRFKNWY